MNQKDIKKILDHNDNLFIHNNILKTVKEGSLLIFKSETTNAIVKDITNIVKDKNNDIAEARLWAAHDDGHESMHVYRYDGISHCSESNDISKIQN